eukprot:gene15436-18306_t
MLSRHNSLVQKIISQQYIQQCTVGSTSNASSFGIRCFASKNKDTRTEAQITEAAEKRAADNKTPQFGKKKKINFKSLPKVPPIQPRAKDVPEPDLTSEQKVANLQTHLAATKEGNKFHYTPSFSKLGQLADVNDLAEDWNNLNYKPKTRKEREGLYTTSQLLNKNEHEEANIQFTRFGGSNDETPFPRLINNNPSFINVPPIYGGSYSRGLLNNRKTLNALDNTTLRLADQFIRNHIQDETKSMYSFHTSTPGVIHSAGTDFVTLFEKRNTEYPAEFFKKLYKFFYLLAASPKPHVSILDGLAVGSGAAFTSNSGFRVVTENSIYSIADCAIGFFPDAGNSRFLARLEGNLGMYLALTGRRLRGAELMECGIGNFYIRTNQIQHIDQWLARVPVNRPDRLLVNLDTHTENWDDKTIVEKTHYETYEKAIDRCFGQDTVEGIIEALKAETEHTAWAQRCIENMNKMSPLALKLTHAFITYVSDPDPISGEELELADYFEAEYRLTMSLMHEGSDVWEGIRANLVYHREPVWKYKTLADVTDKVIEHHLNFEPESKLSLRSLPPNCDYFEDMVNEYVQENYVPISEQDERLFNTYEGDPISKKHEEFIEEFYKGGDEEDIFERNLEETILDMAPEDLY